MAELKPVQPTENLSLSRWSRLKRAADEQAAVVAARTEPVEVSSPPAETPDLPALSSISLIEDFTPFMQARVPQALKQQALKALFKEPHFNVMDGLDTYIDDYTVFEPITPEVMNTLSSWKTIMNPPQQVVTPGGYAVDSESEEGKAVLAAREALQNDPVSPRADISELTSVEPVVPDAIATTSLLPGIHPRHGRRVGEFVATDPMTDVLTEPPVMPGAVAPTPPESFA